MEGDDGWSGGYDSDNSWNTDDGIGASIDAGMEGATTGDAGNFSAGGIYGESTGPSYGEYSGVDFDNYAWGDPTVGYMSSPDEASAAWQTYFNNLQQQAELSYSMPDWMTGRTGEEEFQYSQDMENWAGYSPSGAVNTWGSLSDRGPASEAARAEYESLYAGSPGNREYTYQDLDGSRNVNSTAVAKGVLDALTSTPANIALSLSGLSPVAAVLNAISNVSEGRAGNVVNTLAGVLGGREAGALSSVLTSLMSGNERGAVGNLTNSALNYAGMNLGNTFAQNFDRGSLEQALAGVAGSRGQSWAIGQGLDALNVTNSGRGIGGLVSSSGNNQTSNGDYRWQA